MFFLFLLRMSLEKIINNAKKYSKTLFLAFSLSFLTQQSLSRTTNIVNSQEVVEVYNNEGNNKGGFHLKELDLVSEEISFFDVSQKEGVFSSKEIDDYIGTSGLSSCIGVVGYSQSSGKGFVAHYDSLTDKDFSEMHENPYYDPLPISLAYLTLQDFIKNPKDKEESFDVYFFIGDAPDSKLLDKIIHYVEYMNTWNVPIKFNIKGVYKTPNGSVALDLRTGEFYYYDVSEIKSYSSEDVERKYQRSIFPGPLEWHNRLWEH